MGVQRSITGSAKPPSLQSVWRTGTASPQIRLSRIVRALLRRRQLPNSSNSSNSSINSTNSNSSSSNVASSSSRSPFEQTPRPIRQSSWLARTAVPPSLRYGAGMRAVILFAMLVVSPISALELLIRSYDGCWLYPTLAAALPLDHLI